MVSERARRSSGVLCDLPASNTDAVPVDFPDDTIGNWLHEADSAAVGNKRAASQLGAGLLRASRLLELSAQQLVDGLKVRHCTLLLSPDAVLLIHSV